MKVLKNCTLIKLREYSSSDGSRETICIPYIKEYENEIMLFNSLGNCTRTMKKGTKLLISFSGKEIKEEIFLKNTKKAIKLHLEECKKERERAEQKQREINNIAEKQGEKWNEFLKANPSSAEKYKTKVNILPSSKWRNYLRMKAAKNINAEKFEGLEISAPKLKAILFNN